MTLKTRTRGAVLTLLLLVVAAGLQAQETLLGADFAEDITKTIVRERSDSESVSYVETTTHRYFALAQNPSIISVEIDNTLMVNDFVIYEDVVYFCGSNTLSQAIIGWFEIQPFFDGTAPYYLYKNFLGPYSPFVNDLYGIGVYKNNERIVIAAAGGGQNGRACILSLEGTAGTPGGWICKVGESSEITERMRKVCVTDSYVVTAGTIFNDCDGISLRVFDKSDMFALNGSQDRYHRYSTDDNIPFLDYPLTNDPSTAFGLTHTRGDSIAVMAEWRYREVQNPYFADGFLIHVYDINNTINMVNPLAEWSAVVYQTAFQSSDREVVGLNYNPTRFRLHFAMRTPAINGSNLMGEAPIPPLLIACRSLAAVDIKGTAACPMSLDCLTQGFGMASPSRLQTYRYALGMNTSNCATTTILRPDLTPRFREKNHLYPLRVRQYSVIFVKVNPGVPIELPNETECQQ